MRTQSAILFSVFFVIISLGAVFGSPLASRSSIDAAILKPHLRFHFADFDDAPVAVKKWSPLEPSIRFYKRSAPSAVYDQLFPDI